ncbi:MAG TPA: WXG100 family type VII secretion target [Pseudonocardiaceae bacterium]|jgi:WXG100 family type VII secretion target|nr:WXG100 family type VII secretion target [Pseudonocardiaceae bacterium]
MSGDGVKVDFGQVTSLAQSITTQANQIDGELEGLKSQISNLETIWQGAASSGFQQTKKAWFDAADDMKATLARIGTAVHAASESYSATESGNAKLWG